MKTNTVEPKNNLEERFVIRIHDSEPKIGKGIDYCYNTERTFNEFHVLTEQEINYARTHTYKTRAGAERGIDKVKRYCVPAPQTAEDYKCLRIHGYRYWADKKVQEYDWTKSTYTFSVITLNEMLNEIRE